MCFQNPNAVIENRKLKQLLIKHKRQMQIMNNYLKQLNKDVKKINNMSLNNMNAVKNNYLNNIYLNEINKCL